MYENLTKTELKFLFTGLALLALQSRVAHIAWTEEQREAIHKKMEETGMLLDGVEDEETNAQIADRMFKMQNELLDAYAAAPESREVTH